MDESAAVETAPPRRLWRWWTTAVGALVLVIVGLAITGHVGTPEGNAAGGGLAAEFALDNLRRGEPQVALTDYRGQPVVLNFWASWCVPCRQEMPDFEAVHEQLGDRVAFVGINHADDRGPALDLLAQTGVTYPSGFDPGGNVAADYGLYGMPTTVFIGRDGRVLEQHTGPLGKHDLEATIERLFPG